MLLLLGYSLYAGRNKKHILNSDDEIALALKKNKGNVRHVIC